MKNRFLRNACSFAVIIVFIATAVASSSINKLHCGSFAYNSPANETTEKVNYVELKDGTKVFGDKISWRSGLVVKDQIKVDDKKILLKETRGYFYKNIYYGRIGNDYAKRIIHGKLNVYYTDDMFVDTRTDHAGNTRIRNKRVCFHYIQRGDDGEIIPLGGLSTMREYINDCPLSVKMIDKKYGQINKAIRRDGMYLNKVIKIYNNGCKE